MKSYTLDQCQRLPVSLGEAWEFFSKPGNLQAITPDWLDFRIESSLPDRMYPGLIITYKIRIFPGIRIAWVTEITHLDEGEFFVDEQRFGPYKFWQHQHHFREVNGVTEIRDIVHYGLPFGPIGRFIHWLIVRRQLREIFQFRERALQEKFNAA